MTINYEKLRKEAEAMGISVYLLIKRKINYREKKPHEFANCLKCELRRNMPYGQEIRTQCEFIGCGRDPYCDVDGQHICDVFRRLKV